jgi:hypothetical protein
VVVGAQGSAPQKQPALRSADDDPAFPAAWCSDECTPSGEAAEAVRRRNGNARAVMDPIKAARLAKVTAMLKKWANGLKLVGRGWDALRETTDMSYRLTVFDSVRQTIAEFEADASGGLVEVWRCDCAEMRVARDENRIVLAHARSATKCTAMSLAAWSTLSRSFQVAERFGTKGLFLIDVRGRDSEPERARRHRPSAGANAALFTIATTVFQSTHLIGEAPTRPLQWGESPHARHAQANRGMPRTRRSLPAVQTRVPALGQRTVEHRPPPNASAAAARQGASVEVADIVSFLRHDRRSLQLLRPAQPERSRRTSPPNPFGANRTPVAGPKRTVPRLLPPLPGHSSAALSARGARTVDGAGYLRLSTPKDDARQFWSAMREYDAVLSFRTPSGAL